MTLEVQFLSMLVSAGTGLLLGASFDTYRRFIKSPKRFRWSLMMNDILFWLLQALLFFYVLLQVNYGEVRFYLLLALLLGYSIYRAIFEKMYQKFLETLIWFITRLTHIIIRTIKVLVFEPVKWLLKVFLTLSMIILSTVWRIFRITIRILLSPIRWLGDKYVQAYGIPFYSTYKKIVLRIQQLKKRLRKLYQWFKRDEKR